MEFLATELFTAEQMREHARQQREICRNNVSFSPSYNDDGEEVLDGATIEFAPEPELPEAVEDIVFPTEEQIKDAVKYPIEILQDQLHYYNKGVNYLKTQNENGKK